MSQPEPTEVHDLPDLDLDDRLAGAAGVTPTWRPFTAEAMQVVHRRAVRRQRTERILSVTCGLFAIVLAASTIAALRPSEGGSARTVRTADDPATPPDGDEEPVFDPSTATTTTRPAFSYDGRNPVHAQVGVSSSDVTFPPNATPTTGPTPTTAPPRIDEARPPVSYASLNGVEVEALEGPSCWQRGGREVCEDADQFWLDEAPLVEGLQSGSLYFRWAIPEQPTKIVANTYFASPQAQPEAIKCEGGNPCRIDFGVIRLGTDPTWIVIETHWKSGKVTHAVKVRTHPVEP